MKKKKNIIVITFTIFIMTILLSACGKKDSNSNIDSNQNKDEVSTNQETNDTTDKDLSDGNIDVDLTKLSSTMVYSEVYNMMYTPDDYIGKTVKMSGKFTAYYNKDIDKYYPAVIVADATACCSQGIEFILEGDPSYPEGYPEQDAEITVTGVFETYLEDGSKYCRLGNAVLQ